MDDFAIHLYAWLCLAAMAAILVVVAWWTERRRDPGDSRDWKPTEAYILGRTRIRSDPQDHERLTVGFHTWRGHPKLLIADIPVDQVPPTDRVWVLYHPWYPQRARLTLDQPEEF